MTPEQIDRVFGRGRLRMVTGEHVEVFREAVAPGERRRYTKRFLNSTEGDFAHWTEREWRILARLIGHGIGCVPDVVQFDRGSVPGTQLVQTYDAGVTVDQWATLLPLLRDGRLYRHAFEDSAHWWALAHHCLVALKQIHQLQLVHLDIKGDNVCIPLGPAGFDPDAPGDTLHPMFGQLALIDFAFALVSGESLTAPLPIGRQEEYDYQSPRLLAALEAGHEGDLRPTRELDWRCDLYSLAAMLERYLPDQRTVHPPAPATGWTRERHDAARSLILTLREHHDRDAPQSHPHPGLIDATGARLRESDLARSLASGWTLARNVNVAPAGASPLTPMTRLAPPIRVIRRPRDRVAMTIGAPAVAPRETTVPFLITARKDAVRPPSRPGHSWHAALAIALAIALGAAVAHYVFPDATRTLIAGARAWLDHRGPNDSSAPSALASDTSQGSTGTPEPPTARRPDARTDTPTADAEVSQPPPPAATREPAADTQSAARDGREADPTAPGAAATRDALAAPPSPGPETAPRPPVPRTGPKAAPPPSETTRAATRRSVTKSAPVSPARPSTAIAAAKAPASRLANTAPRASPTTIGSSRSAGSAPTSGNAARVELAPLEQFAQLTPQPTPAAPAESTRSTAPQPGDPAPPSNSKVDQESRPSSLPESPAATAPKSASPARRKQAPSASDDWRSGIGLLSQLFGLVKRKAAPIEDRSMRDAEPPTKASRAPQAPASLPDRPVAAGPNVDAPPPALPGIPPPPVLSPLPAIPEGIAEPRRSGRARGNDFAMQARRMLAQGVPRMARQTQIEVSRVLWAAANAQDPRQEREVVDHAQAIWVKEDVTGLSLDVEPGAARRLHDEAMQAYSMRRNVPEAFDLALRAFGANPSDPEIAGNLAFLHLRVTPVQPETARQLALHAIAVRGSRFRTGRLEDWNTFALASAMTGRDADARNALFVTVALAGSVERNCKAGLIAIASYGERVREPVEAMLHRIHAQGRAYESPYCAWPPNWAVGMRRY